MSSGLRSYLDCDHYGDLAAGLVNFGVLSYFPDASPTVARGPIYPLLISFLLVLSNHWFPEMLQLTQCVFFGLLILLVHWIAKELYGREVALLSAAVCALHPFLLWYTPKVWLEVILTLSFTSIIAGTLYLRKRPSLARALLLGLLLGFTRLIKATVLPFIVLIPLWLAFVSRRRIRATHALVTALVAVLCVMPWSVRNYRLTGTFIPVHVLLGYNLIIGDEVATHWHERPFSQGYLFAKGERALYAIAERLPTTPPLWERELLLEKTTLNACLASYAENPWFLFKKVMINGLIFWFLAGNILKSSLLLVMQLPFVLGFFLVGARTLRKKGLGHGQSLLFVVPFIYYAAHLPIFAFARFSLVLVPMTIIMTMSAFTLLFDVDAMQEDTARG